VPNIFEFDRLYRRTKTGVGVTGQVVRLRLNPIRPKTLRVLTHVSVENKTGARTKDRLGINAGGRDHYLDEIMDPAQNELIVSRSDILLGEGDYFFAEFIDTENGDELLMTCIGWDQGL